MTVPAGAREVEVLDARGSAPAPVLQPQLAPPTPEPRRRPPRRRGPDDVDPRPGHIPGLDGIRALAIIGVLIFHFTPTVLPGGFLGVDVFFVLSGFLITTLLLRDVAGRGRIDLKNFWLRRARRLLPALVTVVVVSVCVARLVGGDLLVNVARQTIGALTFSTNWVEIGAGASYFHHTSPQLFVNFWSLAVEEQFYLFWPLVLGVLLGLTASTRQRLIVVLSIAGASALAMALLFTPGEDGTRVYYGTDTHLFALMLGVALAFAWASRHRAWLRTAAWRRWRGPAVASALVVLVLLMRTLTDASAWTFRGGILLAALATVVLIAGLLESGGPWRVVMSLPPVTWLGRRSYGIYLWHWPVLTILGAIFPFADGTTRGWLVLGAALTVTLLLSEVSFRYIETPVRRHGFRASIGRLTSWVGTPWEDRKTPRVVAGVIAVAVLTAAIALVTAPERSRTAEAIAEAEAALNGSAQQATGGLPSADDEAMNPPEHNPPPASERAERPWQDAEQPGTPAIDVSGFVEDDSGLLVPSGDQITAIGDSLVVTSADGLKYRFEGMNFVAESNKQWRDAVPVLTEALANGEVRSNVIVHLGTNAGVDADAVREFLDLLGPDRAVVLMNLYSRSTFVPGSNDALATIAAEYDNVALGDWNAAATAEPETLQSDRIHPDIPGMHVYARVVAESFDSLARGN